MPPPLEPLAGLAKAGSQEVLQGLLEDTFHQRESASLSEMHEAAWQETLQLPQAEVKQVFTAARFIVQECLYRSVDIGDQSLTVLQRMLPNGFDAGLASMIDSAFKSLMPVWREAVLSTPVSLPRLLDVDWRVDVKTSANTVSRMAAPSALVELQLAMPSTQSGVMGEVRSTTCEMSGETLQTMLDGLSKIREQLSSV